MGGEVSISRRRGTHCHDILCEKKTNFKKKSSGNSEWIRISCVRDRICRSDYLHVQKFDCVCGWKDVGLLRELI